MRNGLEFGADWVGVDGFYGVNLLEEIKTFRWYHDNQLPSLRNRCVALHRCMAKARSTARG